jgi:NAD-dependent SIR2 family protein deacetylase
MADDHQHLGPESECAICRNKLPFEMPTELVDACADGRLVIFAGAGASTESSTVLPYSFYEHIAAEIDLEDEQAPFPEVMSAFVRRRGRRALLQHIKERLDYVDSFPELRSKATRFHRELGTLYCVQDVVTTNWDTYFEDETGCLPLVTDQDFALWDLPGRKVFKIHGSILNVGSLVVTSEDYDKCYRALSRNMLGATLKHLLATKTVLFVGYSFGDSDFNRIYRFMRRQMPDVLPRSYIVTLGEAPADDMTNAHVIRTDAAYFVEQLKAAVAERGCLLGDDAWDGILPAFENVLRRHLELYAKFDARRLPAVVPCGYYQDGLIHSFERMLRRRATGQYSHVHEVLRLIDLYDNRLRDLLEEGRFANAAYVKGYVSGLAYLIADEKDRRTLPTYHVQGSPVDLRSVTAFHRQAKKARSLHPEAYAEAKRIAEHWGPGIIPHHPPLF